MSKIVLDMSMSLDGFIAGPGDDRDHGLGVDGEVLHAWLWHGGVKPRSHRPVDETNAAVPVLLGQGRRLFDHLPPDHIELELLRSQPGSGVLHLRYRVQSGG